MKNECTREILSAFFVSQRSELTRACPSVQRAEVLWKFHFDKRREGQISIYNIIERYVVFTTKDKKTCVLWNKN